MNLLRLIGEELKAIIQKPQNIIYMLAVMTVPLIYAGMFLYAFWDTYGRTSHLPVAVVNQDNGTKIDGEKLNAGDELVKELKKNKNFGWQFISLKKANDGFKNNQYFMVVQIPENFSENAATLSDQSVKPSTIHYKLNADYNYVASKMTNAGLNELKYRISNQITRTYAETMYKKINKLADGLENASKGSKDLAGGGKKEVEGLKQLEKGFRDLMNGTGSLTDGSGKLASGAADLNTGLRKAATGTDHLYSQTAANSENIANLANGANTLSGKLDELNKSVSQLPDGSARLSGGSQTIANDMNKYLDGLNHFQAALQKEKNGLDQLNSQVTASKPQIEDLVNGINRLDNGANQLSAGISQLAPLSSQVSRGVNELTNGLPTAEQIQTMKSASASLQAGLEHAAQGGTVTGDQLKELAVVADQLNRGINSISAADPKQIAALKTGANAMDQAFNRGINGNPSLVTGSQSLKSGLDTLNTRASDISAPFNQLSSGVTRLSDGMNQLIGGQQALQSNFIKLADGEARLASGMTTLQTSLEKLPGATHALGQGADQIASGNNQLNKTWPQLVGGIRTLQDGTDQLASGSSRLASHMSELNSGLSGLARVQNQLADGASQLRGGAQKIWNGNTELADRLAGAHHGLAQTPTNYQHAQKFSRPVTASDDSHQKVDTFGSGFAPYFISLGLFVGALLLTIVYNLGRSAVPAASGIHVALSKFFVAILIAVGQSLILDAVVLKGLGLQVAHPWTFIGFTILTSITFMAIVEFLAGSFDNVGRFLAVILLIFQLVTCGGAYAIQLIPNLLQPVGRFLPMTYSVNGFRNLIDGNQQAMLVQNTAVLVGFMVLGLVLSLLTYSIRFHKNRTSGLSEENSTGNASPGV
ncbi:YhgE/Pip domain-containing protein [Sporolactobacillus sp. THM7-4]|nr:YhgE/Pip domain-containing protein [Sporolactobacillus sp. THM7-4]